MIKTPLPGCLTGKEGEITEWDSYISDISHKFHQPHFVAFLRLMFWGSLS